MGVLQRFGRFVVGGSGATKDAATALRQTYADAAERLALLELHTDLAPQDYSRQSLKSLVAATRHQLDRIRGRLRERGVGLAPSPQGATAGPSSLNHWARLVHDLELHRSSTRRLRELCVHFADVDQEISVLFDALSREDYRSCEHLRALIARADPQALD
jgi:hypothetical protein